ncbi:MAG: hypothetical protein F6K23_08210 [Okeania sp. SIO2C9]|uniref:hypothetical protein n=1 Tax=Okeania sp. SIO2C9 TaxID=2607791 RepID=UPI0013C1A76E|nr:hypothetical protein [Okeania sp. SIO2C9]NEQ73059.1 hypothetical protein [Okeania sp. SIO2C9]
MKNLTVDSKKNCLLVDKAWMENLQKEAASASLDPGMYVLRIKSGSFSYGSGMGAEPFVLLWIYGGKFVNLKTNVETSATWSSLNGYDDTITLEVKETITVSALFLDVYEDDNSGEVTVSILDA